MTWDPDRYNLFKAERAAPFDDLLQLVNRSEGLHVVDLGCGMGELTQRLADALPGSHVTGVDSSPEMLAQTQEYARPGLRFELGSIEETAGEWDLIFSNAALQWVEDHHLLIPRLLGMVRSGGQLVVQMPSNHHHPNHRLIRAIAVEEPFSRTLNGWIRRSPVLTIDEYAELLYSNSGRDLTIFEKVYPHVLDGPGALADWTSGTALLPYMDRLPEPLGTEFMAVYRARLGEIYAPGPVFYGFRRTLLAATRS